MASNEDPMPAVPEGVNVPPPEMTTLVDSTVLSGAEDARSETKSSPKVAKDKPSPVKKGRTTPTSYKMTGRRVFRMAPLHHHFEQMGWEEPKIVIRFWIIAWILAIAGLATLKLR
jgi:hypothetical protein